MLYSTVIQQNDVECNYISAPLLTCLHISPYYALYFHPQRTMTLWNACGYAALIHWLFWRLTALSLQRGSINKSHEEGFKKTQCKHPGGKYFTISRGLASSRYSCQVRKTKHNRINNLSQLTRLIVPADRYILYQLIHIVPMAWW